MTLPTTAWRPRTSQPTSATPGFGLAELISALIIVLLYSFFLELLTRLGRIQESASYYVIMLAGAVFLFVNASRTGWFKEQRPILIVLLSYLLLVLVSIVLFGHDYDIWLYRLRLSYVITTAAIIVIFASVRRTKVVILACRLVLVFSVVINLIEFFHPSALPVQMSSTPGRAAGFYGDSNESAAFIACLVPISCLGTRPLVKGLIYLVSLIGVYVTFSRGGLLVWTALVMISEFLPARAKSLRPAQLGVLVAMGLIALVLILGHDAILGFLSNAFHNNLDDNTSNRMRFGVNDASRERLYVVMLGLQEFARSPVVGKGIGYGFDWSFYVSVHNIFVQTLLESGIVGAIWLGFYLFAMGSRSFPYGIWNVVAFCIIGMFSHNLFDGPRYGIIVALYCTIPAMFEAETKTGQSAFLGPLAASGWRPAGAALPRAPRRPWAVNRAKPQA